MNYQDLPNSAGCYIFKDKSGRVIYVGKAKSLKKRVASYYAKKEHDIKTQNLISNIADLDVILTDNETEALILENNLIKKYFPKYNILLKDSKRYAYIQITDEDIPRLLISRNKGKNTYGPFVSAATRDYVLDFLKRAFQLRTCKRIPKKACLRYHIKLCSAPCVGYISKKDYHDRIDSVKAVLRGNITQVAMKIKQKMERDSDNLEFERAMESKNQLGAILYLSEKQKMERNKKYDEDILNFVVKDNTVYLMLFNVHKGILENKQEYVFEYHQDFIDEFIVQYYSENIVSNQLVLPHRVDDSLLQFLKHYRKAAKIIVPQKGEKAKLLELVKKNIELQFFGDLDKLEDLQKKLRLNDLPKVIECFDVSHLSGTSTAASMVQFRNAKPDKSNYRRFKIRTVEGIDDFSSVAEVVRRRYRRLASEREAFPDLVVIDGGKGQLKFALAELQKLGVKIPIISLAKRFEEIYVPGLSFPIILDKKSKALKLLQEIRDEAHRFAIKYNRLLRSKKIQE